MKKIKESNLDNFKSLKNHGEPDCDEYISASGPRRIPL
jgi:hypothetical protein